jgi:hypothetical protein
MTSQVVMAFDEWSLCVDQAYMQHDERLIQIMKSYEQELIVCESLGTEECLLNAEKKLKDQQERSRIILTQNKKACLKMPWLF